MARVRRRVVEDSNLEGTVGRRKGGHGTAMSMEAGSGRCTLHANKNHGHRNREKDGRQEHEDLLGSGWLSAEHCVSNGGIY